MPLAGGHCASHMSSRGGVKRPRTVMAKGGKGTSSRGKGGQKSVKGDEDELVKERNYRQCPSDATEIGAWLRQQVAHKGSGTFSKKRSDENYRALELGNVMMLKYKSCLPMPMTSTRPRPER